MHLLFQVLLTHSHTLPAKSQNFLIALFVSTAAFAVVVAFVFVLSFERFFFSLPCDGDTYVLLFSPNDIT